MRTTFIDKEQVAEGTVLFRFAKPAGFEYRAGQSIDLTLVNPSENDNRGPMRPYTLVSAPHEAWLGVATRMRDSAFKRVLHSLDMGAEVEIEGPFGSFFLHDKVDRPAVFLVGGIGVTPFYSMVKDATERKLTHTIYMFYSNKRPEDAAFLRELRALEDVNVNFMLIPTMTEMERSVATWTGEHGVVSQELIKKYLPAGKEPVYYLAGPQGMVTAMRELLTGMSVSNDDIRFEEFSGY